MIQMMKLKKPRPPAKSIKLLRRLNVMNKQTYINYFRNEIINLKIIFTDFPPHRFQQMTLEFWNGTPTWHH